MFGADDQSGSDEGRSLRPNPEIISTKTPSAAPKSESEKPCPPALAAPETLPGDGKLGSRGNWCRDGPPATGRAPCVTGVVINAKFDSQGELIARALYVPYALGVFGPAGMCTTVVEAGACELDFDVEAAVPYELHCSEPEFADELRGREAVRGGVGLLRVVGAGVTRGAARSGAVGDFCGTIAAIDFTTLDGDGGRVTREEIVPRTVCVTLFTEESVLFVAFATAELTLLASEVEVTAVLATLAAACRSTLGGCTVVVLTCGVAGGVAGVALGFGCVGVALVGAGATVGWTACVMGAAAACAAAVACAAGAGVAGAVGCVGATTVGAEVTFGADVTLGVPVRAARATPASAAKQAITPTTRIDRMRTRARVDI